MFDNLFEKGGILKMERKRFLIPVLAFIMLLGLPWLQRQTGLNIPGNGEQQTPSPAHTP